MRVLVLGGTGFIGGAIIRELINRNHTVLALARSAASAGILQLAGATVIAGDIASPDAWLRSLPPVDAVIHAAAAFTDDDERIERQLLDALLPFLAATQRLPKFIYTGGCWLFAAGDSLTTEASAFDPLPSFAWSVRHIRQVLGAPGVQACVVHPGMVYVPAGGVFARFYRDAIERAAVRVVGGETVRWPLVHRDDLAALYALVLENSPPGESYLGVAVDGLAVGRIARAYARRFRTPHADPEVISADDIAAELGSWARGYALDQRQSGAKARTTLRWAPQHLDPVGEIGALS
jgi:nucleoside-diphosphate-sugar epimerase